MRRLVLVLALLLPAACGGSRSSTNPTPAPTTAIRLQADLSVGNIQLGKGFDAILRISSDGTAPLTVTGLRAPRGYTASWTKEPIAPGTSQAITIRFSPSAEHTYKLIVE